MDAFGYMDARLAARGAGVNGPRWENDDTPHYALRNVVGRMVANGELYGDAGLARALREQTVAIGADSEIESPVRRLELSDSPEPAMPTKRRCTARTRARKQANPQRINTTVERGVRLFVDDEAHTSVYSSQASSASPGRPSQGRSSD